MREEESPAQLREAVPTAQPAPEEPPPADEPTRYHDTAEEATSCE